LCHSYAPKRNPGPEASLSESEVITLAIFARWNRFASERDFYRYAEANLRDAFPTLPERSQFNRLMRSCVGLIEEVALHLAVTLNTRSYVSSYEALDTSARLIRDAKRRGEGWLAGYADIGWSNSLGCYEGFCLLVAVNPVGANSGCAQALPGLAGLPLDPRFGLVAISPRDSLYVVRADRVDDLDRRRRLSPEIIEAYGDVRISST
jgi:hypothetical protein